MRFLSVFKVLCNALFAFFNHDSESRSFIPFLPLNFAHTSFLLVSNGSFGFQLLETGPLV